MDRIAALRNVEDALSAFEQGDIDLTGLERQVQAVLRTYATEFNDDRRAVYRVGETVVVADSPAAAREQAATLVEDETFDPDRASLERLSE